MNNFLTLVKIALLLTLALGFLRDADGTCAEEVKHRVNNASNPLPTHHQPCVRNVKSLLDNASGPPSGHHSRCVKNTVDIGICNKFYTAVTCRNDNGCRGRPATMIRVQCCDGTSVTLPTDCY